MFLNTYDIVWFKMNPEGAMACLKLLPFEERKARALPHPYAYTPNCPMPDGQGRGTCVVVRYRGVMRLRPGRESRKVSVVATECCESISEVLPGVWAGMLKKDIFEQAAINKDIAQEKKNLALMAEARKETDPTQAIERYFSAACVLAGIDAAVLTPEQRRDAVGLFALSPKGQGRLTPLSSWLAAVAPPAEVDNRIPEEYDRNTFLPFAAAAYSSVTRTFERDPETGIKTQIA